MNTGARTAIETIVLAYRGPRYRLMLKGYFDDSGHSGDSDSVSIAGCIACLARWKALEGSWKQALVDFGLTEFKMSAFTNKRGEFLRWTVEKRESCLARFLGLMDANIEAYAGASNYKVYPDDILKKQKPDSYHKCFVNTLLAADFAVEEFWDPIENIQLVFDIQKEFYEESLIRYRKIVDSGVNQLPHIHGITHADSIKVVQVQTADIVAYEFNQQILMMNGKRHKSNRNVWNQIRSKPKRFLPDPVTQ